MTTTVTAASTARDQALQTASQKATGDFNMFLKLLAAQLQNQDPLNPTDSTEFTSQIATYSQLEQQINTNKNLNELLKQNNFGAQALAVSYMGKEVLVPGGGITIENAVAGVPQATFGYELDAGMSTVDISVVNQFGQVVANFAGDKTAGGHTVAWDGIGADGQPVPNGSYTLRIKATDLNGKEGAISAYTFGRVREVETLNGIVNLALQDGRSVSLDDVMSVRTPSNS